MKNEKLEFDIKEHVPDKDDRGKWNSKTEYILSCLGYAIGIGNVWRFPYLCYRNGGGAFLVPYIIMLFVCGIPLFFLETCWGQFGSAGCIKMFRMSPLFKGAGYASVIVNILCSIYYNVIISYPLLFIVKTISWELPWANCNNKWNTIKCLKLDGSSNSTQIYMENRKLNISERLRTPADEFFHNEILQISSGVDELNGIVWPLFMCNMLSWILIFLCIRNGVKSVGKVVYITATFPFIILSILLIRGITLPGAIEGIKYYITPQWDQLSNINIWADASIQIFFSLGPGWGGIVNMASYNKFRNNTQFDSLFIPIMNCGTSIFAGFVVFSVLGYMANISGLPVSSVVAGGPGLAFVTYPEAIAMLPMPQLWAILFFIMLYLLGMDSCFVSIEAVISSVLDEFPRYRTYKQWAAFFSCFIMFLGSISCVTRGGMYLVQLLDWYVAAITILIVCVIEILIVNWIYGIANFFRDVEFMLRTKLNFIWKICLKYITQTILIIILYVNFSRIFDPNLSYNGVIYPEWSIYLGWSYGCVSTLIIPIYIIYMLLNVDGSLSERLRRTLRADNWEPALESDKMSWRKHCNIKT